MFAIYDKRTKNVLYFTRRNPMQKILDEETGKQIERINLPEDHGFIECDIVSNIFGLDHYQVDEENKVVKPIMIDSEKLSVLTKNRVNFEEKQKMRRVITDMKIMLKKYKEDVEQVELFGMERTDYEDKKKQCRYLILQLRKLQKEAGYSDEALY